MPNGRARVVRNEAWARVMTQSTPTELLVLLVGEDVELSPATGALRGPCPSHPDRTRSLYVSLCSPFYHCFACGRHGDVVRWVAEREGIGEPAALASIIEMIEADEFRRR